MRKAIVYAHLLGRGGYGYVGTMDNTYGNDVYGKDKVENVSVIITFSKGIDGVHTIYNQFNIWLGFGGGDWDQTFLYSRKQ